MKKLLALLLCVAMIGSMSVTAFARGGGSDSGIDLHPIDLHPIVQQANHLYGKLQSYGFTKLTVDLCNGFGAAFPKLIERTGATNRLMSFYYMYKQVPVDVETGGLLIPENMDLDYALARIWWTLGNEFVGVYMYPAPFQVSYYDGSVTAAIAGAELSIPTVTAPAAFDNQRE